MLVGVLFKRTLEELTDEIHRLDGRVDAVEVRLDYLEESAFKRLDRILSKTALPALFTFRRSTEGGRWEGSETERLKRIEEALSLQPAFADLEWDVDPSFISKMVRLYPRTTWIGSYHDFEKTPMDLESVLAAMQRRPFSIYKLACFARSTLDLLRLMIFGREHSLQFPLNCVSLGAYGRPSRALGPVIGNFFDYTSTGNAGQSLHQINLEELQEVYRYSKLSRQSQIYALLGDPIEQSRGHLFHNEMFQRSNFNGIYIKLQLLSKELPSFFSLAPRLPFAGFSVTSPLKEAVGCCLSRLDPEAAQIGAVNTVRVHPNGTVGFNTDAAGALNPIERRGPVRGKTIAILGAGGAARAVAFEAIKRGARAILFNRTTARAKRIAEDFDCEAYSLDEWSAHPYHIVVNTIPFAESSDDLFSPLDFSPGSLALDINAWIEETPFLVAARKRGCRCISGSEMFEEQAHRQQAAWRDKK